MFIIKYGGIYAIRYGVYLLVVRYYNTTLMQHDT